MDVTALLEARKEIDEADALMAPLFVKRMAAVKKIAAFKAEYGMPIEDSAREKAVLANAVLRLDDTELYRYYEAFLKSLMDVSRQYQLDLNGKGTA